MTSNGGLPEQHYDRTTGWKYRYHLHRDLESESATGLGDALGLSGRHQSFSSVDGGSTWSNVSGTLPNIPVNCIVYQNGSNDALYIGTDFGVYYRDATLTDWVPHGNDLPNVIVSDMEIYYAGQSCAQPP